MRAYVYQKVSMECLEQLYSQQCKPGYSPNTHQQENGQCVIYSHNEILSGNITKLATNALNNMGEFQKLDTKDYTLYTKFKIRN